ncbi:WYL domain-containing protein [Alkalihalobacillus sp. CinArs1]|uniref:WYL domain-containing protein n=1 Tax=Alkalihalobacillus sp. CinArs1 TaxID=2995314 RepID=UPI0022DE00C1|nr:WYL domain-containing protein [Alkalihalobacillus sp. CinArs1]
MFKVLQNCLQRHLSVDMIYMTSEQMITKRTVTLYKLSQNEIKGYCHLRRSIRTFKVDRVLAVYPTMAWITKKYGIQKTSLR